MGASAWEEKITIISECTYILFRTTFEHSSNDFSHNAKLPMQDIS